MNNFWRAFRLALRYRLTLVGIVVSSLAIAIFWGGNLGTVYPIVDIVLKDRSLRTWIDENIETGTRDIAGWQQEIAEINADLAAGATRDQTNRLSYLASRVEAEEKVVRTARRWQPWVNQYTPAKPFTTLVMVIILLFVGTLFKSLFLVLNVILVRRISLWVAFDLRKLLYRRTLRMNLNDFGEDRVSTLMSHFTHEMDCLTRGVETVFGRAVREPLKIIACLLGAAWICWPLLVLSLVVTPIAIYGINRLATYIKRASSKAMEGMAEIYSRLHESLTSIELVKAYTTERSERRRFHHSAKNYARRAEDCCFSSTVQAAQRIDEHRRGGVRPAHGRVPGTQSRNPPVWLANNSAAFELRRADDVLRAVSRHQRSISQVDRRVQRNSARGGGG